MHGDYAHASLVPGDQRHFIKGEYTVDGIESHIEELHMKVMDKNSKITVPCCDLMNA